MSTYNKVLICCTVVIVYSSCVTAFFLSWGSSERKPSYTPVPLQQPTYQRRHLHAPYAVDLSNTNENSASAAASAQVPVPAVPVQVPLQATFLPSNLHNVQLVPCLCPVAEDYEYDPQTDTTLVITQKPNKN